MRATESHDYFSAGEKKVTNGWTAFIGWLLAILIGMTVSTVAYWMKIIYAEIQKERIREINLRLIENDVAAAFGIQLGWMVGLVGLGVVLTLLVPAIGGSGLPALIAELNGSKVVELLTLKTTVAKVCGATLSVASGLACGPEGPIIHIGGCLGALVLRAVRKVTGQFTLETDMCDFVSTGSGAGVAAAFKAPIAGTLFVVEEASSFFSITHLWKTFVACVTAYFMSNAWNLLNRHMDLDNEQYEFEVTTGDGCGYKIYQLGYFMILGCLGGLLGAVFNYLVETLNTFRGDHINHTPWKRAVEALLIVIFHCTVIVVLPKAFSCQSHTVGNVINHDVDIKCFDLQLLAQFTAGTKTVEQVRYQNGFRSDFQNKIVFKTGCLGGVCENSTTVVSGKKENEEENDETKGANDFEYNKCNAYCRSIPLEIDHLQSYSCKREDEFNPLATLMLNYGGNAVKMLFKRGMQDLFHAEALLTACIFYFLMAAMVCGMCIPSGLVVPMLFIGGTFGRLFGLGVHHGWDVDMDPAYCAFVGAAAFMGGTGRILMFLSVVLLEVSNDLELFPSIVIALLIAQYVGNNMPFGNHGLYHCLIDVQGLPYLPSTFQGSKDIKIKDIMVKEIHQFKESDTCEYAWRVLLDKYDDDNDGTLEPTELVGKGAGRNYPVVHEDGSFSGIVTIDSLRDMKTHTASANTAGKTLGDVMAPCAVMAKTHWNLAYGYSVFERLGLRQMVVVDECLRPVGMVTRMTLLPWWPEYLEQTKGGGHHHGDQEAPVVTKGDANPLFNTHRNPEPNKVDFVVTSDHYPTDGIQLSPRGAAKGDALTIQKKSK